MVLDNDGVASKTTKEKVKSLDLKAKITREQTSNDSDYRGGSDEDVDEEEEAEAFNLLARNFCKFFRKVERHSKPQKVCLFSLVVSSKKGNKTLLSSLVGKKEKTTRIPASQYVTCD
ncbi:hypothetical protein Tco_1158063 [Tanacetum coccineum]